MSTGSRLPTNTRSALARIEQRALIQTARIQATAYVGREALLSVADISELEGQLARLCPLATSRLESIANMTALAIAARISEFRG